MPGSAATVVVWWAPIWMWAQPMFGHGRSCRRCWSVCLIMLGVMLAIWRMIENRPVWASCLRSGANDQDCSVWRGNVRMNSML